MTLLLLAGGVAGAFVGWCVGIAFCPEYNVKYLPLAPVWVPRAYVGAILGAVIGICVAGVAV